MMATDELEFDVVWNGRRDGPHRGLLTSPVAVAEPPRLPDREDRATASSHREVERHDRMRMRPVGISAADWHALLRLAARD